MRTFAILILMKTKFILHGGMMSQGGPDNEAFFQEFVKDLEEGDTVLWIGFARKEGEDRERIFIRDTGFIAEQSDKSFNYINATIGDLESQLKAANAIFVTGGNSEVLVDTIKNYPKFTQLIAGKTYAGSSAGACLVSTIYYHCSKQRISEGIGLLPIRTMVHYKNPEFNATDETLDELKQQREDLELLVLPECQWQIMKTNR